MNLPPEGLLLRIFVGESDKYKGTSLYEWIVVKAKEEGMAGATAFRGLMGFGANSRIHTSKILRLSLDLPVVVEIVDTPGKIEHFLSVIQPVVREGLVTLEKAEVRVYRAKDG